MDHWIGKEVGGRYKILKQLGAGGMATVYQAQDPVLNRIVAIKIIHNHLSTDTDFVRRFQEEASMVANLRHPHIVSVHDLGNDGETYFIVFEYVDGVSLQDYLWRLNKQGRQLPVDEIIKYISQIAAALDYAHEQNLIHRDVKPANIMVNLRGDVILMDFGIAKIGGVTTHTATGGLIGTPRYISPEQIKGQKQVDRRADIYSLGAILYEMAAGEPPYDSDAVMMLLMMHTNDPIPRMTREDLPDGVNDAVQIAMAKEPDDRFQSAGEMAAFLDDSLDPIRRADLIRRNRLDHDPATPPTYVDRTKPLPSPGAERAQTEVALPPSTPVPASAPSSPWWRTRSGMIGGAVGLLGLLLAIIGFGNFNLWGGGSPPPTVTELPAVLSSVTPQPAVVGEETATHTATVEPSETASPSPSATPESSETPTATATEASSATPTATEEPTMTPAPRVIPSVTPGPGGATDRRQSA